MKHVLLLVLSKRQLNRDLPVHTYVSGGIDVSIVLYPGRLLIASVTETFENIVFSGFPSFQYVYVP